MDEEILFQAQLIERQATELENNLQIIDAELSDLKSFSESVDSFSSEKGSESFSSLGKGVFIKTKIEEKEFYVNVGSGVLVKKSSAETKKIIDEQISKLSEAKTNIAERLEAYHQMLYQIVQRLEHGQNKE